MRSVLSQQPEPPCASSCAHTRSAVGGQDGERQGPVLPIRSDGAAYSPVWTILCAGTTVEAVLPSVGRRGKVLSRLAHNRKTELCAAPFYGSQQNGADDWAVSRK